MKLHLVFLTDATRRNYSLIAQGSVWMVKCLVKGQNAMEIIQGYVKPLEWKDNSFEEKKKKEKEREIEKMWNYDIYG